MSVPTTPVSGIPIEEDNADLKPVRVLVRQLDYQTVGVNPLGQSVMVIKTAYGPEMPVNDPTRKDLEVGSQAYEDAVSDFQHGELIMVRPEAYVGLISSGVVRDVEYDDAGGEVEEEEVVMDVNTASADDLAVWIREEHPTVNDVVQASGGDSALAEKLLEAESKATDGEPRAGVVKGLTAVISRG